MRARERAAPRGEWWRLGPGIQFYVVLLVLSAGLLGVAGVRAYSLVVARAAVMRARATELGNELVERMLANRAAALAYADANSGPGRRVAACHDSVTGCTPLEMALTDKADWGAAVAASLPGGRGSVAVSAGASLNYSITLAWIGPDGRSADCTLMGVL